MKIVFFIIIIIQTSLHAQEDYTFNSLYRSLEEGQSFYVLKPSRVHAAPFATAAVLGTLSTGVAIQVEERMDEMVKINGFRTNWYRIVFDHNGRLEEGYLWGGSIAVGAFVAKDNSNTLFLYGIDHIGIVNRGNYTEESIHLILYALDNYQVKDSIVFEAMGTLYTQTQGKALGNKGIKTIKEVIEVAFSDGYCGGVAATVTIFWDGNSLFYISLLSNGFSSETFSNRFYIYPDEQALPTQTIILRNEAGTFDVDRRPVYTRQVDKQYIWTKNKLTVIP